MCIDDVGVAFTYGEAIDLVDILADEPGTYLHAALHGWSFPMSRLERDMRLLAEAYHNVHRQKDAQLVDLGWPYPAEELVTQEEREALTEQLIRRSALADR